MTVSSNLNITKTLACYYDSGGVCVAPNGAGTIPLNPKLRYLIAYANAGGGAVSNVVINDTLPCHLSAVTGSPTITITAVTGAIVAATTPLSVSNGNCPSTIQTVALGTATSLPPGASGTLTVEMTLRTPLTTTTSVINQVNISGTAVAGGSSQVQNTVLVQPNLVMSKTSSPSAVAPGSTLSYTITIINNGTTAAQSITVFDWLPTGTSTIADPSQRFSFTGTTSFAGSLTAVATTVNTSPTQSPYNSGVYRANQQELVWNFGTQALAVGGSLTIRITAVAGTALVALAPPNYYYNNAQVNYLSGQQASSNAASANVSNVVNLTLVKTNGVTTIASGNTTIYTVTVANLGPSSANGAVINDTPSAGLNCVSVTCPAASLSGGAACPASMTNFFTTGSTIGTFPVNSSVSFLVTCQVTASGQ